MKIFSTQWINNAWTQVLDGQFDSENTLVLVFGASGFFDTKERFNELRNCYPTSILMGCSTSGEIFGSEVNDESLSVSVIQFEKNDN